MTPKEALELILEECNIPMSDRIEARLEEYAAKLGYIRQVCREALRDIGGTDQD